MYNMNILSQWLNKFKSNHYKNPYCHVEKLQDPTPGTTYGSRFCNTIFNFKKGGKTDELYS